MKPTTFGKIEACYRDNELETFTAGSAWPQKLAGQKCPECAGVLDGRVRLLACTCVYHAKCCASAFAFGVCSACRMSVKQWQYFK